MRPERRGSDVTNVLSNPAFDDATRREHLYRGDVMVYGAGPSTLALVDFTRGLVEEAFGDLDPELAQYSMDVHDFAALLAELKPRFIHHPRCKELLPQILSERGCDLDRAHLDVGRLPDHRDRLRVPPAPRHLVLGADVPDQLVDAGVPGEQRQRHGLPPEVHDAGDQERVATLRLRGVEQVEPPGRREAHRQGHP
jgi:hypothetical protein